MDECTGGYVGCQEVKKSGKRHVDRDRREYPGIEGSSKFYYSHRVVSTNAKTLFSLKEYIKLVKTTITLRPLGNSWAFDLTSTEPETIYDDTFQE